MRLFLAVTALLLSSAGSLSFQVEVEGWLVRNFAAKERGQDIIGCMASRNFADGTRLSFVISTDYSWAIGMANEAWQLRKDGTTDVAAYVDRKFTASGKAWHVDDKSTLLPLTGVESYRALQKGQRLDLQTPHGQLNFALQGTGKAMSTLLDCVRTLSPNQPLLSTPPPQSKSRQDFQMVAYSEASELVARILAAAGLGGYRFDPPKQDNNFVNFHLADGTRGLFMAARGAATKNADDYAGTVIANWSEFCKGEFISGKQAVPSVDGSVVRKIVTTCRMGSEATVSETTVIRRSNGFLMELSLVIPASAAAAAAESVAKGERAALVDAAMRTQDVR